MTSNSFNPVSVKRSSAPMCTASLKLSMLVFSIGGPIFFDMSSGAAYLPLFGVQVGGAIDPSVPERFMPGEDDSAGVLSPSISLSPCALSCRSLQDSVPNRIG